jgi:AcrR family transcriptional regulator
LAIPQHQRSDATKNREAILRAAFDALSESPNASLNSIAKRAEVANATLYRHFPTRGRLVLEVYRQEVHQLVDMADELLEQSAPVDALEQWVERLAQYAMTKHGLANALGSATTSDSPLYVETYDLIVSALARLLAACEGAGSIRPGLDADDVLLSFAGLWEMDPKSDWKARARRLYEIIFSGLSGRAS